MDNRLYDIFLSYRRSDGVYPAYQLYHDLCDANYSTFFDMKSMRSGPFPNQLRTAIHCCSDFILLATKDTFSERIFDEEDWIRIELKEAIESSRTQMKIMLSSVSNTKRNLALQFQRSFEKIDEDTAKAITEILNKLEE